MESSPLTSTPATVDLMIIGGGINGTGIAADAAGRGLRVALCEQGDLAGATSSASSKLVHGGLRYLEHYEFRLVKEALAEREVLLSLAPHLVRPLRFTMPHLRHLRPGWMIRTGLFLYDHLAARVTLPGASTRRFNVNSPLKPSIKKGYAYSDCWVDDARLVIANAQQARLKGAKIMRSTRCISAARCDDNRLWKITLESAQGQQETVFARSLVNASGPWAAKIFGQTIDQPSPHGVRLIKGSHMIVPRFHDAPGAFILQNTDRRIVFVLPYEDDFHLIGTTDKEFNGDPATVAIDDDEIDYLLDVVNNHFVHQLQRDDIVSTYSGVRPLLDDESTDPAAITRDYTISVLGSDQEAPLISIFGGKITTYRKLAEAAVNKLTDWFPSMGSSTTRQTPLPGATRALTSQPAIAEVLQSAYPALSSKLRDRLARTYGINAIQMLGSCRTDADLGVHFGGTLHAREVDYLIAEEWAESTDDVLWRRTKQGLRLSARQVEQLADYIRDQRAGATVPEAMNRAVAS
ncbi:glycerol-3-phosphate dehydrogenase [Marinobacter sp. BGYM27]|uniref:glycerol-3-phosphate dehydrogenase n=1 Tax=Marinobacter sp. BGYM27 TaxID=2975597 RepID=UPI0021A7E3B9|nr:glycerol-3-phosphate dehydrogenase [Marinobacter sp. BGYM27]MDG5498242.1 glycerol-3-phosphate dehydrogenase [Marinobacter sp. BGYM27]